MKKLWIFFVVTLLSTLSLVSCSSSRNTIDQHEIEIAELDREDYVVLDPVEEEVRSTRFWLLFIPFGGKKDEKMKEKAYTRAVEQMPEADGLLKPRYVVKKTVIPLIVFNFTFKKVSVRGKGFRIKSESEMQLTKSFANE